MTSPWIPAEPADPDYQDAFTVMADMAAATTSDPVRLEDAHLAQWAADEVLSGRWCWASGLGWLRWDGRRWKRTTEKSVGETVRLALIDLHTREAKSGANTARLRQLDALLSAHRIRAVAGLAAGIVEAEADAFDAHPDLLNVGNGVVDLASGELRPHDPSLRLTKVTNVNYRPEAIHSDWTCALRALPAEVADWLQVRVGQAATGHMTSDDLLPVLQGGGANGKTTITASIRAALGEHAVVVPERVLLANPSDHPTELMTLKGARLALIEETPEARHLSVKRLKDTVGTPTMSARYIRQDNVTWDATHSLLLTTNYPPRVDEADHGTWRRLALVRFPYTFSGTACDPGLRDRLHHGREGRHEAVLAWIVAGARRWYAADRTMPEHPAQVVADTATWRADADAVFAYLGDRLVFDPAASVLTVDLLADFNDWLGARGGKPWSDQTLTIRFGGHAEVERRGVVKTRTRDLSGLVLRRPFDSTPDGKVRVWQGIRWSTAADDETAGQTPLDRGGPGVSVNSHEEFFTGMIRDPRPTPVQAPETAADSNPPRHLTDLPESGPPAHTGRPPDTDGLFTKPDHIRACPGCGTSIPANLRRCTPCNATYVAQLKEKA